MSLEREDIIQAFEEWNGPIYRYVYSRVGSREMAEDLAQEVFVRAWKYRDSFDVKRSSLKNWLFAIAVNVLRDFWKERSGSEVLELDDNVAAVGDSEEKSDVDFVLRQVRKLSEAEQELVLLRYGQDLKVADVAKILGKSFVGAKVALHRVMKKLRKLCNQNRP